MEFRIFSKAFKDGELIPDLYTNTRRGKNISPPLQWEHPPEQTKYFAITVEDVDAPIFGIIPHWILYNIPSEKRELQEGIPQQESLSDGTIQGKNFFRRNAYMGPNPPFGTHRYYFKIFALDAEIKTDLKMTRKKLLKAMGHHILGQAQLMGIYSKTLQFREGNIL
ncbi:MAG: YbhB/YbcL family Raf kinase inhibitor-like protein [candidate division WOR-3 bacterium]|nr:YbhB/YbcL family Raf kinase inhibitor-like protein [candidate division WOR-3 bacterium]